MNWKRGLIRAWIVVSSLWLIAGVAIITIISMKHEEVSRERTADELAACIQENSEAICRMLGEVNYATVWVWPSWPMVAGVISIPLVIFALGAVLYWAAMGFRSN